MRRRSLAAQVLTPLNGHLVVVVLLLLFDLVLATRLAVAWHDSRSDQSAQYNADLITYAQLQAQAGHLQALPARLAGSRHNADTFLLDRIPASDSVVVAELGVLTARDHVKLSRAAYTPARAIPGLVELRIEANVAGDYTQVMHFLNDLERDKEHAFFTIRTITLTGQQGGLVNLRVRFTTYMRTDAASAPLLQPAPGTDSDSGSGSGEEQ